MSNKKSLEGQNNYLDKINKNKIKLQKTNEAIDQVKEKLKKLSKQSEQTMLSFLISNLFSHPNRDIHLAFLTPSVSVSASSEQYYKLIYNPHHDEPNQLTVINHPHQQIQKYLFDKVTTQPETIFKVLEVLKELYKQKTNSLSLSVQLTAVVHPNWQECKMLAKVKDWCHQHKEINIHVHTVDPNNYSSHKIKHDTLNICLFILPFDPKLNIIEKEYISLSQCEQSE